MPRKIRSVTTQFKPRQNRSKSKWLAKASAAAAHNKKRKAAMTDGTVFHRLVHLWYHKNLMEGGAAYHGYTPEMRLEFESASPLDLKRLEFIKKWISESGYLPYLSEYPLFDDRRHGVVDMVLCDSARPTHLSTFVILDFKTGHRAFFDSNQDPNSAGTDWKVRIHRKNVKQIGDYKGLFGRRFSVNGLFPAKILTALVYVDVPKVIFC